MPDKHYSDTWSDLPYSSCLWHLRPCPNTKDHPPHIVASSLVQVLGFSLIADTPNTVVEQRLSLEAPCAARACYVTGGHASNSTRSATFLQVHFAVKGFGQGYECI